MKRALFATAAGLTLVLAGGCSKSSGPANEAAYGNDAMAANEAGTSDQLNNAAAATAMGNNMAAPGAVTAQQFVDTASATDAYEIAAAKLAESKSSSKPVKDFAAQMIKDHTKSTADLKTAAAKADGKPTVKGEMTAEQQANLTALQGKTGADFDSAYISQQVDAHQKALAALQSYAQTGDSPPLKDFASNTAKVVEHHLDMAQKLAK